MSICVFPQVLCLHKIGYQLLMISYIYISTFFLSTNQLSTFLEIWNYFITQKNQRTASPNSLCGGKTQNRVNDPRSFRETISKHLWTHTLFKYFQRNDNPSFNTLSQKSHSLCATLSNFFLLLLRRGLVFIASVCGISFQFLPSSFSLTVPENLNSFCLYSWSSHYVLLIQCIPFLFSPLSGFKVIMIQDIYNVLCPHF